MNTRIKMHTYLMAAVPEPLREVEFWRWPKEEVLFSWPICGRWPSCSQPPFFEPPFLINLDAKRVYMYKRRVFCFRNVVEIIDGPKRRRLFLCPAHRAWHSPPPLSEPSFALTNLMWNFEEILLALRSSGMFLHSLVTGHVMSRPLLPAGPPLSMIPWKGFTAGLLCGCGGRSSGRGWEQNKKVFIYTSYIYIYTYYNLCYRGPSPYHKYKSTHFAERHFGLIEVSHAHR